MIKKLWAKWRAWATIDDTIEALVKKHFAAAVAFEQHAEKKFTQAIHAEEIAAAASATANFASMEAKKAKEIAGKVRAIFA